jgi:hypothetical protein
MCLNALTVVACCCALSAGLHHIMNATLYVKRVIKIGMLGVCVGKIQRDDCDIMNKPLNSGSPWISMNGETTRQQGQQSGVLSCYSLSKYLIYFSMCRIQYICFGFVKMTG